MIPSEFFAKIAPLAVGDWRTSKVLPSLTLAQAALESNWGESSLTKFGNNLFGIKGKGGVYPTTEYIKGKATKVQAQFKHYPSWRESIVDHSTLLNRKRYAKVVGTRDWKVAIREIYIAGYATDPAYPSKLMNMIERYELYNYDIQAFREEDGGFDMDINVAQAIIKSLQKLWSLTKEKEARDEIHRQAEALRKAVGIK